MSGDQADNVTCWGEEHRAHHLHHPKLLADPPPPVVLAPLARAGAQLGAEGGLGAAPATGPAPRPVRGRGPAGAEPARALLGLGRAAHSNQSDEGHMGGNDVGH